MFTELNCSRLGLQGMGSGWMVSTAQKGRHPEQAHLSHHVPKVPAGDGVPHAGLSGTRQSGLLITDSRKGKMEFDETIRGSSQNHQAGWTTRLG